MVSKDKNTLPTSQTTTSATEETTAPLPSDGGLAGIAASTTSEAGKRTDVVQKVQVSPDAVKGRSKESPPAKVRSYPLKTPPSPAMRTRKYALEIWIKVELSPGVYAYPEDDTYSSDFAMDTLNLAIQVALGCTSQTLDTL